jgi:hypothetical protein
MSHAQDLQYSHVFDGVTGAWGGQQSVDGASANFGG